MSPPGAGRFWNCWVVNVVVVFEVCVSINCALFALTSTVWVVAMELA